MTKVKGRSDSYAIYFGKNDQIDEAKFKENIVEDDDSKCHVVVSFKNEYNSLIQQKEDKDNQIMQLNNKIKHLEDENAQKSSTNKSSTRELYAKIDELKKEKTNLEKTHENNLSAIHSDHEKEIEAIQDEYNAQIDELNRELSAKGDENQDLKLQYEREISDLKQSLLKKHHDEESAIASEKQKIIDDLKNDVSDMKIEESDMKLQHQDEIHAIKLQHQADISDLKSKYKDTLVKLRTKDNNDIASHNKKTSRIVNDLKDLGMIAKHTSKYGNLLNELDEALDEFETINKNKLLTIDEDFAKIPSNAVNENNEDSE